ncbi:hypothetical protein, partial [Klebsiella oxytoca]|uniref:hypothetical protein n=1 Tax=Klebsiella oxytoca TaxID=571 RepID=UPI0022479DDA
MREFASTVESPSSLSRLALRLAGLRVHRRLWAGSPDRRVRRRLRVLASFPGGDASHLSGLRGHHRL